MSEYDFIVVGTGAGGATVAARLSENPSVKVLALEAGPPEFPADIAPRIDNASIWYTLLGSDVDWKYFSEPQPGLNGRKTFEPRGKVPGGSSNFYIMMHIRGHASDYDNWAYNGCPGWSYEDCQSFFQKSENQEDNTSPWAGHGGAMDVTNAGKHSPNPTSVAFIEACKELGYPETQDFNGPNMEGTGWHHINVKDGHRRGTYASYVVPALTRPNFTLSGNSMATRLLFEGKKCVGVEYNQGGTIKTARANHEVIVCGGAIETPKLLLLSGIGQPEQLGKFNIPVVSKLPGVGENFHNHVLTGVIMETTEQVPAGTQNLSESALFLKSEPGWVGPDLQIAFVHVPFDIIVGQRYPNAISILPGVVRPLSRGWIRLASADPLEHPLVNPNYLGVQSDADRLAQGVKLAREIFATKAFSQWVKQEVKPGPETATDAQVMEFTRNTADSYHHQAGSCKMGKDAMAVVDPQLRVYGVEGLRIADASVFPQVPSGNCHSGIVMIAERCADWLKQTYGLN
ncbi:MAG TPA: GMC family oxidoreductase N-terminal domain-containing protein [Chthonomonadaceae bacterium]|nr:GMC family oxidoreductase N-terminal domain-containing protein [Chthonomonadaceae bacterium]